MVVNSCILAKLAELEGYLHELRIILPVPCQEYPNFQTKRAVERVLQMSIEIVIDICKKLVIGLHLGIPLVEAGVFDKLEKAKVLSDGIALILKWMHRIRKDSGCGH